MAEITSRQVGDVTVLDIKGKITIGAGAEQFGEAVREALANGARKLLLSMADVSTMDSAGIGELASSYTTSRHRGVQVKLVNLSPKVSDILHITRMINVFDVYGEESEALASFS